MALGDSNTCDGRDGLSLHPASRKNPGIVPASTIRSVGVGREVARTRAQQHYDCFAKRVKTGGDGTYRRRGANGGDSRKGFEIDSGVDSGCSRVSLKILENSSAIR
jgi:hypothetical protein